MLFGDNALLAREAREEFLRLGRPGAKAKLVRPELVELWSRCLAANLDPEKTDSPTSTAYNAPPSSRLFPGKSFAEFTEQIAAIGGMVTLLQLDCSVLHAFFAPCLGWAADPEVIRSTAAGLLDEQRHEAWLTGAEHYLKNLHGYASYAWQSDDPFSRYIVCVVLPAPLFSDIFLMMIANFRQRRILDMRLAALQSELARQTELFNQLKNIQEDALILVDYSQKILCVNRQFEQTFELAQTDIIGRDASEIMPELEHLLICIRTGKGMQMCEVSFEGLPERKRNMYVNCNPWKQNGTVNGMVIALKVAKRHGSAPRQVTTPNIALDDLIGESSAFVEAKKLVRSVADSNSSILLTGESGTGKELFARAIHNDSVRAGKPFVAVNCSAIPKELIGSELFGYGDGAFTGARKGGAMGKFEYAHGGTLLLDEIGELPLDVQAILLRVLEERAVVRLGDHKVTPVDVRIISATNRDLGRMISEQTFRLDLYYRLNVINLELPPLRNRRDDIPLLAQSFIENLSHSLGKNVFGIAKDALEKLCAYDWPGNIRQLRNVLERGVNIAGTTELRLQDLPPEIFSPMPARMEEVPPPEAMTEKSYEDWERKRIWDLMQQFRANKSRIAEELGMSRGTLYKKLRRYGL